MDDTGSKYTIKPTTLDYYEYNYHENSLTWINLLLKVFLVCLNLHNKHAINYFFWKCIFCSLFVFIQRFHKVAILHQSITKIRAGAQGEGKWEFGWMRRTSSRPETGHPSFSKGARKLLFLPSPTEEKNERKKKKNLTKVNLTKKKSRHKENKEFFFHAHIFCIAQPTYSKALFPFVTGVHSNLVSATVLCDH